MNEREHLLTIVMEECAEVAQRASKALRFGLFEVQPEQGLTNAQRLMYEFEDLRGVIEMLQERGLLPGDDVDARAKKKAKVAKFLNYSDEQGTLTRDAFGHEPMSPEYTIESCAANLVEWLGCTPELARKLVMNGICSAAAFEGVEESDLIGLGFTEEESALLMSLYDQAT